MTTPRTSEILPPNSTHGAATPLCRASVVVTREPNGNAATVRQCLAPVSADGHAACEHGDAARAWVKRYAA